MDEARRALLVKPNAGFVAYNAARALPEAEVGQMVSLHRSGASLKRMGPMVDDVKSRMDLLRRQCRAGEMTACISLKGRQYAKEQVEKGADILADAARAVRP